MAWWFTEGLTVPGTYLRRRQLIRRILYQLDWNLTTLNQMKNCYLRRCSYLFHYLTWQGNAQALKRTGNSIKSTCLEGRSRSKTSPDAWLLTYFFFLPQKKITAITKKYSTSHLLAHDIKPNVNELEVEITVTKCFVIRAIITKARLQLMCCHILPRLLE